jgi:hypothetical protein
MGIEPWASEAIDRHPDMKALDAALMQGQPGTFDKQVVATFTGTFKCESGHRSRQRRILNLETVEDIVVTRRPPKQ